MSVRFVTEKPLHVAEPLRGAELASPSRRAAALAIDFAILIVPSVAVGLAAALLALSSSYPRGLHALRVLVRHGDASERERHAALRDVAPLLVRLEAEGLPAEARVAVEAGDLDKAADVLATRELLVAMSFSEESKPALREGVIRLPVERLIPPVLRGVALYGVAATYFTLLGSFGGRTLGKRLFGIRVARLDGHRLSLLESLERFIGFLEIPGTLGLTLAYLWRDPNRRLPHDRLVHTVVVRSRKRA